MHYLHSFRITKLPEIHQQKNKSHHKRYNETDLHIVGFLIIYGERNHQDKEIHKQPVPDVREVIDHRHQKNLEKQEHRKDVPAVVFHSILRRQKPYAPGQRIIFPALFYSGASA